MSDVIAVTAPREFWQHMIDTYTVLSEEKAENEEQREDWLYAVDFVRAQISSDYLEDGP